jgi:hypothetical protein
MGLLVGVLCFGITLQAMAQRNRAPGSSLPERNRPAVSVLAGASPYDLSGTGTAIFGSLRYDVPWGRLVIIEPGLTVLRYENQFDENITYLLPEVSAHVQVPSGPVRPYLGGGLGFTEFLSGRGGSELTLHAAAGVRVLLTDNWGIRGEARLRSIDPFVGNTFDLGLGFIRRLGVR